MSNINDFVIENGVLTKYTGAGEDVVITDSVTSIGKHAFVCCTNLTNITIPDMVARNISPTIKNCCSMNDRKNLSVSLRKLSLMNNK